jgi:type IV pilus assembly protein PilE
MPEERKIMSSSRAHPIRTTSRQLLGAGGFTLIEVLTVIMIIGILTAIALPNYNEYVRRSQRVEAFTNLSDMRVKMEQSYLDNRSYTAGCGITPPTGKFFTFNVSNCTATTYTWNAVNAATGDAYTINESNVKTTTSFNGVAQTGKNCWLSKVDSEC